MVSVPPPGSYGTVNPSILDTTQIRQISIDLDKLPAYRGIDFDQRVEVNFQEKNKMMEPISGLDLLMHPENYAEFDPFNNVPRISWTFREAIAFIVGSINENAHHAWRVPIEIPVCAQTQTWVGLLYRSLERIATVATKEISKPPVYKFDGRVDCSVPAAKQNYWEGAILQMLYEREYIETYFALEGETHWVKLSRNYKPTLLPPISFATWEHKSTGDIVQDLTNPLVEA